MSITKFWKEALNWKAAGGPASAGIPTITVDGSGNTVGLLGSSGTTPIVPLAITVPSSRSVTAADFDNLLICASGITMIIPTDATLGITNLAYAPTITFQQAGVTTMIISPSGVTFQGSLPGIAQYGMLSLIRVGANTWAYL